MCVYASLCAFICMDIRERVRDGAGALYNMFVM